MEWGLSPVRKGILSLRTRVLGRVFASFEVLLEQLLLISYLHGIFDHFILLFHCMLDRPSLPTEAQWDLGHKSIRKIIWGWHQGWFWLHNQSMQYIFPTIISEPCCPLGRLESLRCFPERNRLKSTKWRIRVCCVSYQARNSYSLIYCCIKFLV